MHWSNYVYLYIGLDDNLHTTDPRIIPRAKQILLFMRYEEQKKDLKWKNMDKMNFHLPLHEHSNVTKLLDGSKLVESRLLCDDSKKLEFNIQLKIILMYLF